MVTLYHGKGGMPSPYVPYVDKIISDRFKALGFNTMRSGKDCVYVTTSRDQALEYARDEDNLFEVNLLSGSRIMIIENCRDLVLQFESWMREKAYNEFKNGSSRSRMISDVQGDINIVDTYLSLNRSKKIISNLVDEFLSEKTIKEIIVDENLDIVDFLKNHNGEIIVNGKVDLISISRENTLTM